jgi:predicted TPR repeat methyltransferase
MTIAEQRLQAISLLQEGEYQRAQSMILDCLRVHPDDPQLLAAQGFLLARSGHLSDARRALSASIASDAQNPTTFNHLGNVYRALGDYEHALQAYHEALRLKPNYPEALNNLGALQYRQGQYKHAKETFDKSLRLDPNAIDCLYNCANTCVQLDAPQEARGYYERLLSLSPTHIGAHHNLGILLVSLGELSSAKPHLLEATQRDNKTLDAHFHCGLVFSAEGDFDKAIEYYQKVLSFCPEHSHAYHNCATLYLNLDRPDDALKAFEKALALNPQNTTAAHFIRALKKEQSTKPPVGFVKDLFDFYAPTYNEHLKKTLHYQAPSDLRAMLTPYQPMGDKLWFGIDIGCGTGLCAAPFTDILYRIVGIDLSSNMLEKAKALDAYHRLHEGDMVAILAHHYINVADCVIAADVMGYVGGECDALFKAVSDALKPGGYFVLSIEQCLDSNWRLMPSGRYAHHQDYIDKLAQRYQLIAVDAKACTLREQGGKPVQGLCLLYQKRILSHNG